MPKLPALPYARASVTDGLTANAAYANYQEAAHTAGFTGMRRQDFLRLVSEIRAGTGSFAEAVQRDKRTVPSGDQILQRTTVNARGIGTWVTAYQRTKGQADLIEQRLLIKTDEPITPEEAERRAGVILANNNDIYDRITLGVTYSGTEFYTPGGDQYE